MISLSALPFSVSVHISVSSLLSVYTDVNLIVGFNFFLVISVGGGGKLFKLGGLNHDYYYL